MAKKSRVEKQSWKEADADIGEYKVLAKIVEDEGFAVDAFGSFRRAQPITSKCAQLVGKWVRFDVMRNDFTFWHVRQQRNHTFGYAWNLFTTEGHCSATSISTDKPAGAETPAQSAGRGTRKSTQTKMRRRHHVRVERSPKRCRNIRLHMVVDHGTTKLRALEEVQARVYFNNTLFQIHLTHANLQVGLSPWTTVFVPADRQEIAQVVFSSVQVSHMNCANQHLPRRSATAINKGIGPVIPHVW